MSVEQRKSLESMLRQLPFGRLLLTHLETHDELDR